MAHTFLCIYYRVLRELRVIFSYVLFDKPYTELVDAYINLLQDFAALTIGSKHLNLSKLKILI